MAPQWPVSSWPLDGPIEILSLQESYIGGIRSLTSSFSFKRGEHARLLASWNPVLDLWPIPLLWFTDTVTHITIGLEWNVSILGKPVPVWYTTQVTEAWTVQEPTVHSTDTNLRTTLAWGAALNYGDERPPAGMSLVLCSFAYSPQHRSAASFDKWRMRKIDYFVSAHRIQRTAGFEWFSITKLES